MTRWVIPGLLMAALLLWELLIGGARLAYAAAGGALIGVAAVLAVLPGWRTTGRPALAAVGATTLFAVYILLRNRFSEVEYIGRLHFFILAAAFAVYLLFAFVLTQPRDRKLFFGFVIFLGVLQLGPAAVQFFGQDGWMPLPFAQRRPGLWRASGFFISPNNFAGFVEMGVLLAASYALLGRLTKGWRVVLLAVALAGAAGTLASGSRGGYLGLGAGVFALTVMVLAVWTGRPAAGRKMAVPALAVGTLIVGLTAAWWVLASDPTIRDRVEAIDDVDYQRLHLWSSSLQQFKLSPLFGTGGFSFLYYGRMFRDPSVQGDPIHVHNDYLQLLADYGWVGAVLFAAVLLAHGVAGVRSFLQLRAAAPGAGGSSDRLALIAGSLAVLTAYLAHSVVEFNVQLPLNAVVVAAVLAALANPGASGGPAGAGANPGGRETAVQTALVLTGALLLAGAWRVLPGEYFVERARYALREKRPAEALDWALRGRGAAADNPEVCYHAGEAALQLSFTSPAEAADLRRAAAGHFAEGLRLFPYDVRLALKLAQARAAAGDYWGAADALVYAGQLDPHSGLVPAFRGIVEFWSGDTEAARDAFEEALATGGQPAAIARRGLELLRESAASADEAPEPPPVPPMPEALRRAAEEAE